MAELMQSCYQVLDTRGRPLVQGDQPWPILKRHLDLDAIRPLWAAKRWIARETHRMAKRTKKTARPKTASGLRSRIERLDRDLIKLLNDRATLAAQYAETSGNREVIDFDQEQAFISAALSHGKGPLSEACLRSVLREVVSGSRALSQHIKVAFLGPAYSYSHLAAIHRFGQSAEMIPVGGIAAVFEEVNRGHADYGVVPLENSTDGRIADTLEMFARLPVRIASEVQMRIHHHLLGKCTRAEIQEVYSRPQALSQCRNWLAKHLPSVRTIEVTSTSTAAKLAQDKPGAAAIASIQAGTFYGLEVLAEEIEDNEANVTRFAVIAEHTSERTGSDKTALMFAIDHKAGALADALAIFKRNRLNMSWIESFPVPGQQGAYLFFVEFDGHSADAKVKKAVGSLARKAVRLEILGSYQTTEPLD